MIELLNDWLTAAMAWLPAGGWHRLAVDAAWQSTLVGGGALLLARLLRERAAARSAVALLAAALCLATPLVSWAVRAGGLGLLTAQVGESVAAISIQRLPSRAFSTTTPVPIVRSAPYAARVEDTGRVEMVAPGQRACQVFAAAWLVASGILVWRFTRSARAVTRVCRAARLCDEAEVLNELERAAIKFDLRAPMLLLSDEIAAPALVAWGRPRLLLPVQPPDKDQLYAVFCHELAHLARRDGLGRLAMELLAVALPWQPLAWLLRREFRTACEEACDDWAVAHGADPVEFAAILTDFIPCKAPALALGMAESIPAARYRILRLLAMQGMPRPRLGLFLGVAGWTVALALLVVLAFLQRGNWSWGGGDNLPPWGNAPIAFAVSNVSEASKWRNPLKDYVIEPPDVLLIDAIRVVPKPPERVELVDLLQIKAAGTLPDAPIIGQFRVTADGTVALGPPYGSVAVVGLTLDEAQNAITKHLRQVVHEPIVSVTIAEKAGKQEMAGEHLVAPDGRVNLGTYGSVRVTGMTLAEARAAIEKHLEQFLVNPQVSVDVFAYNSKVYYIIVESVGSGDQILRVPVTGNETVLDALSKLKDFSRVSDKYIWVARQGRSTGDNVILPVDWQAIVQGESTSTNWELMPGDRLFVRPKK